MKIVIIGSGNLSTQLSLALKDAGKEILQVYSRTEAHAMALARKVGCDYTTQQENIRKDGDIYIISVKDDAIRELVDVVCRERKSGLFLHTAGSIPMNVFEGCADNYGVLYPMQTFSKNRKVNFREIPCFVEASSKEAMAKVRQLAETISDHVIACDSEKRKRMHLAAVLACNLTNHCYRLAERVLETEQMDFKLFLPLIAETARKVELMSPKEAQTGPMVRYDQGVMNMQMDMLPDERTREIYRLMAESIHEDAQS